MGEKEVYSTHLDKVHLPMDSDLQVSTLRIWSSSCEGFWSSFLVAVKKINMKVEHRLDGVSKSKVLIKIVDEEFP